MRNLVWVAQSAGKTFSSLLSTLRRQRLVPLWAIVVVVFALALFFAFMAAAPFLSPFIYPLF